MKLIALLCLIGSIAFAAKEGFGPSEEKRIQKIERVKVLKDSFNIATGTSYDNDDNILLGSSLPAGAFVVRNYAIVKDNLNSASANPIAMGCVASNDLLGEVSLSTKADNSVVEGVATGETGAVYISSACALSVTVGEGSTGIDDGEILFITEYVE